MFQGICDDIKSPYVRVADDAISDRSMFAYRYFNKHLLCFAQKHVPFLDKKSIEKLSLGIAALYAKNVVHADMKTNNTLVGSDETDGNTTFQQV